MQWLGQELFDWPGHRLADQERRIRPRRRPLECRCSRPSVSPPGSSRRKAPRSLRLLPKEHQVTQRHPRTGARPGADRPRPADRCPDRADGISRSYEHWPRDQSCRIRAVGNGPYRVQPFRLADGFQQGIDRRAAKSAAAGPSGSMRRAVRRTCSGTSAGPLPDESPPRGRTGAHRIIGTWVPSKRSASRSRTGFCYGVLRGAMRNKARRRQAAGQATRPPWPGRPQRGRGPGPPKTWHCRPVGRLRQHRVTDAAVKISSARTCTSQTCMEPQGPQPRGHRRRLHLGDPGAEEGLAPSRSRGYTIIHPQARTKHHPEVIRPARIRDTMVDDDEEGRGATRSAQEAHSACPQ